MKKLLLATMLLLVVSCAAVPTRWISTAEYPDMDFDRAWQIIVSTITEDFDIDVIEKESGYLLTAWKPVKSTFGEDISGWDKAGVRVTCKVEKREPFQLKLRVQRGQLDSGQWIPKSTDEKWEKELLEKIEMRFK